MKKTLSPLTKIALIGQGYVGLPLALELAKHFKVIGFDINQKRIAELNSGLDSTREADEKLIASLLNASSKGIHFTFNIKDIQDCDIYIVTVPTPINEFKSPNLKPLKIASDNIGSILQKGNVVIYESTVYPGCTEEVCIPILEKSSGLVYNQDFFVGYSPERINPGDKVRPLTKIKKVTSGSNTATAELVDQLYETIIEAGTHLAPSIKVAEASKAIENAQRDVNISFVNELALIFDRIGIDTTDVIDAAATKWNFLPYKPGLVGGHCIGVDPYYLAYKAESLGYHPQVILSGRRVNDHMGMFVANKVIKLMISKGLSIKGSRALVMGITFKENCPDIRNSKAIDVIRELDGFGLDIDVYDPWALPSEVKREFDIDLKPKVDVNDYATIVLVVAHTQFLEMDYSQFGKSNTILYDVKSVLPRDIVDGRL